jgi:hypothetical protein
MRGMFFLLGYFFAERNIDCRFFSLISFRQTSFLLNQMLADDIPWLNLCQIILLLLETQHLRVTFRERGRQSKIALVK